MNTASELEKMVNEHSERIQKIVESSKLSAEEQGVLSQLFQKLDAYQMQVLKELRDNIRQEQSAVSGNRPVYPIVTRLMSCEEAKSLKCFEEIAELKMRQSVQASDLQTIAGVFLECGYEKFADLCQSGKKFHAAVRSNGQYYPDVEFTLRLSDVYVAAERRLQRVADQYRIRIPLLFSPYSRRFAEICFDDVDISIEKLTEFQPEEGTFPFPWYFSGEYRLYWNISVKELLEKRVGSEMPREDGRKYCIKEECKPNQYVTAYGKGTEHMTVWRDGEYSFLYADDPMLKSSRLHQFTIHEVGDEEMKKNQTFVLCFRNVEPLPRVYSLADICYMLRCFQPPAGVVLFGENAEMNPKDCNELKGYPDSSLRYYKSDSSFQTAEYCQPVRLPSRNRCCIAYSGDAWYTEDYVRCVLAYMEKQYSELNWTGRRVD